MQSVRPRWPARPRGIPDAPRLQVVAKSRLDLLARYGLEYLLLVCIYRELLARFINWPIKRPFDLTFIGFFWLTYWFIDLPTDQTSHFLFLFFLSPKQVVVTGCSPLSTRFLVPSTYCFSGSRSNRIWLGPAVFFEAPASAKNQICQGRFYSIVRIIIVIENVPQNLPSHSQA